VLADGEDLNEVQAITTPETMSQGSQPCQAGASDRRRSRAGDSAWRWRIPGRAPAPDLQEQQRDDQRAERGQHVGQRVVDEVRGDELATAAKLPPATSSTGHKAGRAHAAVENIT
jgi:hypothetical protein